MLHRLVFQDLSPLVRLWLPECKGWVLLVSLSSTGKIYNKCSISDHCASVDWTSSLCPWLHVASSNLCHTQPRVLQKIPIDSVNLHVSPPVTPQCLQISQPGSWVIKILKPLGSFSLALSLGAPGHKWPRPDCRNSLEGERTARCSWSLLVVGEELPVGNSHTLLFAWRQFHCPSGLSV